MPVVFWLVIAISLTVIVAGNLDSYPGLRFNFNNNNNERRPRFKKTERSTNYNFNYPNTNPNARFKLPPTTHNIEDYAEATRRRKNNLPTYEHLPETIQQLRQIINWEREQLNENRLKMLHSSNDDPIYRFDLERAAYREIPTKNEEAEDYWNNNNNIVRSPSLDEARMYPQDDDFGFENDNIADEDSDGLASDEEMGSIVLDQPVLDKQFAVKQSIPPPPAAAIPPDMGYEEDRTRTTMRQYGIGDGGISETFPSGRFSGVKIVSNPNEFAYAPPNPLFYMTTSTRASSTPSTPATDRREDDVLTKIMEPQLSPKLPPPMLVDDDVKVNQRSDLRYNGEENVVNQLLEDHNDAVGDDAKEEAIEGVNMEVVAVKPEHADVDSAGVYIIAVVAGISAAATVGLIAVGIGWYNLQKHAKNGGDIDYPAYGITGPNKDLSPTGERRLAQSAQMYHYQHQKQQIISMERVQPGERHGSVSEAESDEENEEGDYTVYECPGLAPTGEMEVKNPLFQDDPTPAQSTPAGKSNQNDKK